MYSSEMYVTLLVLFYFYFYTTVSSSIEAIKISLKFLRR